MTGGGKIPPVFYENSDDINSYYVKCMKTNINIYIKSLIKTGTIQKY